VERDSKRKKKGKILTWKKIEMKLRERAREGEKKMKNFDQEKLIQVK